jgi:hypothetical protein
MVKKPFRLHLLAIEVLLRSPVSEGHQTETAGAGEGGCIEFEPEPTPEPANEEVNEWGDFFNSSLSSRTKKAKKSKNYR